MSDRLNILILILFAVSIVFAVVHSLWWLVAIGVLWVLIGVRWHIYRSRPWRRFHYPLMRAYAGITGAEEVAARAENRDFDFRKALSALVKIAYPGWNDERVEEFVEREFDRCEKKTDLNLIRTHIMYNEPSKLGKFQEFIDEIAKGFETTDKGTMVRMVIAGIIEEEFSETRRGEYLYAALTGRAK